MEPLIEPTPRASALHFASLGVWLGALGMAGVTAAVLFPTMRELDPTLPAFASYTEPQWAIAAGHAAARVFAISEVVQWVTGGLALGSLIFALWRRARAGFRVGPAGGIRVALVVVAVTLTCYQALVLGPRMDRNMHAYWNAARAGEVAAALEHKRAFDADHPRASRAMSQTFAAIALALALGCWSAGCVSCAAKLRKETP